ncbi:MAG: PilZ domain-containing protein [Minicystis sp.]
MDHVTHAHRPQDARFAASAEARRDLAPRSRRMHKRVPARGVASLVQARDLRTPGLTVENISMGGLFVRSASPLDPGTPVLLQVVRPGLKRAIQIAGRVVSVVSPAEARARGAVAGMGIGFDRIDGDAEQRLRALVDNLAGAAAPPAAPRAPEPPTRAATAIEDARPASAVVPAPVLAATLHELAAAREDLAARDRRIEEIEAELKSLRKELLRRNRTIGELANRLSSHEKV